MSGATTTTNRAQVEMSYEIRLAEADDAVGIATAVAALLEELGATPPPAPELLQATELLLRESQLGAVLVAEARDRSLVGVLAASWQAAIHVPGRYGLIQDLWVHPSWRSKALGGALLKALSELASELDISQIEVGLPKKSFSGQAATEAFYLNNGFAALGPRMRRAQR